MQALGQTQTLQTEWTQCSGLFVPLGLFDLHCRWLTGPVQTCLCACPLQWGQAQLPLGQWDTDWTGNTASVEGGWEDGAGSPAVGLRIGSHVESPNGLIGVSGNGRYLTRVISQSWMKRLEAGRAREGGSDIMLVLSVQQDPLGVLSFCITTAASAAVCQATSAMTCSIHLHVHRCPQHVQHKHYRLGSPPWICKKMDSQSNFFHFTWMQPDEHKS